MVWVRNASFLIFMASGRSLLITHLWYFVSFEDERDAGAAVVKVTAVGLALGVQGSRRIGRGTNAPLVAGRREAGEELVLHTLVTSGAGRGVAVRGRQGLLEETGPTTTPHLVTQSERLHIRDRPGSTHASFIGN